MNKLFVFCIGGTGSRVLRSLVELLASGVKIDSNFDTIVPIIIDPDEGSGEVTRTINVINTYKKIRKELSFDNSSQNTFFGTDISTEDYPKVILPLKNTQNSKFSEYIGYDSLSKANKALASMLFSKKNLASDMTVGFKGNPNVGSVVLNQLQNSEDFQKICQKFSDGDRIFVISSIFGGTGASGFPILVKNLRSLDPNIANSNIIRQAPIGAITVLPYFNVEKNSESEIDSSTFMAKTKAALTYYNKSVKECNAIYYVGDDTRVSYKNSEGGSTQKNNAHVIEFISALSIIDFMSISNDKIKTDRSTGCAIDTIYKEYGVKYKDVKELQCLNITNFSEQTLAITRKPLSQFVLFMKFLDKSIIDKYKDQTWAKELGFSSDDFYGTDFYKYLSNFREMTISWYKEMEDNKRGFSPFVYGSNDSKTLFDFVKGVKHKGYGSHALDSNYDLFNGVLTDVSNQFDRKVDRDKNRDFIELFYKTTDLLVDRKLVW